MELSTTAVPAERTSHIHDLPGDCLLKILSLVGGADHPLPIERPKFRDLVVLHPLQCALVCKRWRACARAAVHTLALGRADVEEDFAERAAEFVGLRHLSLAGGDRAPCALHQIAHLTPNLESLVLNWTSRPPIDVLSALTSWASSLVQLNLAGTDGGPFSGMMPPVLYNVLPTMKSLQVLLLHCEGIDAEAMWECLRLNLPSLKMLHLQCVGQQPPACLAGVPLLSLHVAYLPPYMSQFTNLGTLSLVSYGEERLPEDFGGLVMLRELNVDQAHALVELPSTLGQLRSLVILKIHMCPELRSLPESIGNLSALAYLHVSSCNKLCLLPDSLVLLPDLKQLFLSDNKSLCELPRNLGNLHSLTDLHLSAMCDTVSRDAFIPDSLGGLKRLTRLEIVEFMWLRSLPDSIGDLLSLRRMALRKLRCLRALPHTIGRLARLEDMELNACNLSGLPESLGLLSSLTRLSIASCYSVSALPASMSGLGNLRELQIEACVHLRRLPSDLTRLTGLRELTIRNCDAFSDEHDDANVISRLVGLRLLWLAGCKCQRCLPKGLENLRALRMVKCCRGMIERVPPDLLLCTMIPDLEAQDIEHEKECAGKDYNSDDWLEEDLFYFGWPSPGGEDIDDEQEELG